jgi:hypothetical protein
MNIRLIAIVAALPLAFAAAQPGGAAASRDMVPAATITGPAVDCVPLANLRDSHIRDDRTIDFIDFGKKGWRNTLPQSCPGLKAADAFSYETSLSRLCNVDIIHVLENWGGAPHRGASCGLGSFTPIQLVK